MNELSIVFLLQKEKLNKQGKCPIKYRITFHQDRKEFSTELFVNPKVQKAKPSMKKTVLSIHS
ncbi:hypothetical protein [Chryseobacterium sp. Mn2064]|uniref:hypothetical protein n=1 Tax=Chryseobacterium sp. Mn2064 TaxID=3395263 RepID=UPI003BBEC8DA